MKKILLGTVFGLTIAASSAIAQPVAVVAVAPAFTWTGFYLGANAGGGWGDIDSWQGKSYEPVFSDYQSWSQSASGFTVGGQVGYNYQFSNNWVLGAEADIAWTNIEAKTSGSDFGSSYSYGTEVEWFGTFRGRLGYAWNTLLVYGTGGAAYGKVKIFDNGFTDDDSFNSYSDTRWGWTAGAGVEWAFATNWTVKAEYLYVDLGSLSTNGFFPEFSSIGTTVQSSDVNFHTLKVGLNYKF